MGTATYTKTWRPIIPTSLPVEARNYEALTKSTTFWLVTSCSLETARRFGGTHHLHLEGRRVSKPPAGFFLVLLFDHVDGGRVPPKCRALSELQGVTTQKDVYFINIVT
jgi:hypothetical protein